MNLTHPANKLLSSRVSLEAADPLGQDARRLLRAMRADALRRYGDLLDASGPPPPLEPAGGWQAYVIARLGGQAVGCAGLERLDPQTAEVRRMYVLASVRGRGIARRLLADLERRAGELGYRVLRLATGNRQPEAIALYESHGFCRIPSFGVHIGDPVDICFEKRVGGDAAANARGPHA